MNEVVEAAGEYVVEVTHRVEGMIFARIAGALFWLGKWFLGRVRIPVEANGSKVATMHPAATLELRVER